MKVFRENRRELAILRCAAAVAFARLQTFLSSPRKRREFDPLPRFPIPFLVARIVPPSPTAQQRCPSAAN